jgi:hypothetical protein
MRATLPPAWHIAGAIAAALIGAVFFFAIIGVFGFAAAVAALALSVALALLVFRRPQAEGMQR